MKLGTLKKILREDLKGDADAKINALVDVLNPFIETVVNALQSRLSMDDNFDCKVVSQSFTSGTSQKLSSGNRRVLGAIPVYCGGKSLSSWKLARLADGGTELTLTFSEAGSAVCKVYLLLG